MKHKTWFQLILKAIGVLLIAIYGPTVMGAVIEVWIQVWDAPPSFRRMNRWDIVRVALLSGPNIAALLSTIIGFYLLMGGKLLADFIVPPNRPYCPDCGYEIRGLRSSRCPECGMVLPDDLLRWLRTAYQEDEGDGGDGRRSDLVRNRPARTGARVAIASLVPIAGFILGPAAVVFGVEGLVQSRDLPADEGKPEAWIAIVLGLITTTLNVTGACAMPFLWY